MDMEKQFNSAKKSGSFSGSKMQDKIEEGIIRRGSLTGL